jgi:hypothetical protein
MSLHHIIIEFFVHYWALYENVLNIYSCFGVIMACDNFFFINLKIHNKLNIKNIFIKSLYCVLMYEYIVGMSF